MRVALGRFELRIPGAQSLKAKRHVLKGLTGSVRQRFDVAVAEVDHQDLWQRATIGVAAVAEEGYHARRVMSAVERHIETFAAVEIIDVQVTVHGPDD
jgi:uncharacterized protein YlxP (DUF503 family)